MAASSSNNIVFIENAKITVHIDDNENVMQQPAAIVLAPATPPPVRTSRAIGCSWTLMTLMAEFGGVSGTAQAG